MTFYFYDLETSGFSPRSARIMQFAGQRTDMDLKPKGKPDNILIKLTDDILPEPDAVLVHGITPQKTQADGLSEIAFLRFFTNKICTKDTIMVGFNNIRFDDEFIRFTLWRNFYDAYEWQWKDNCSKWDLLDVVRMTRALRPDGIEWPYAPDGKPSNRLEFLSSLNKLEHDSVHDAESDVKAVISVAKILKKHQPKLFEYLLGLRSKKSIPPLVESNEPFVYTSGRYPSKYQKTTVAIKAALHPDARGSFVYDLRTDPQPFIKMSTEELAGAWKASFKWVKDEEPKEKFPLKLLSYNRCPAVAPMKVLDEDSIIRLQLNLPQIDEHLKKLRKAKDFEAKIIKAHEIIQPPKQPKLIMDEQQVDGQLYDGFISGMDKNKMAVVRAATPAELKKINMEFADERLGLLFPLYKARNYPENLSANERKWWGEFKARRLLDGGEASRAGRYFKRLEELYQRQNLSSKEKHLLKDLESYGRSVVPI